MRSTSGTCSTNPKGQPSATGICQMPSTTSSWMKKTKEGVAGKGKIALDKRAQPTLAQRVTKVLAKK